MPESTAAAKAAPLPCRANWLSKRKVEPPTAEESFRAQGVSNPQKDLTQCGGLNYPEETLRVPST